MIIDFYRNTKLSKFIGCTKLLFKLFFLFFIPILQSPNQKIPDRKTKCVIETHLNIKQNVIFGANLKPV